MSVSLPTEYVENMKHLLKEDYPLYEKSFEFPRVYGLRVNTLKISVEEFLKISPFHLTPIPWSSDGFYYSAEDKPAKHPYYYAGLYYLQEPSAMIPAEILPIEDGDVVLDGCAAPGGKSTELASKLERSGILFSNDISASRCQGLLKNIELAGIKNSYVISEDLSKMAKQFEGKFDKILLDVPCSGEGMFRKDSALIKSWMERGNDYYVEIQKSIVASAIKMLKEGGKMVYSTCTFSVKEDEEIIRYLMDLEPSLKVLKVDNRYEMFAPGLLEGMEEAIRVYPFKVEGEGHFAILLQKGEGKREKKKIKQQSSNVPKVAEDFFKYIDKDFISGQFMQKNDKLYLLPECDIDLKGVRIIRSGLLLGTIKNNRFEPSVTLALALQKQQFKQVIDLKSSDERVIRYLKGETLDISDIDNKIKDWVLVCVDSFPLGWGKCSNGSLKNKYEAGFRWQ